MATKVHWYQRSGFLRVFSFIAAVVLIATTYSWADLIKQSEQEFVYYFQPKAAPGYVVISDPVEVRVTFRGSERAREELASETRREITHALEALPKGKGEPSVREHSVRIPEPDENSRLTFVRMDPETVSVQVDESVTLDVKIRPVQQAEPAAGYHVRAITADPESVSLRLPRSFAPAVVEISTVPVSIRNLDANSTFENVALDLPNFIVLDDSEPETVTVKVEIVPEREIRLLDPVLVEVRGVPRGYEVTAQPSYISIQAQVPKEREGGRVKDMHARVDAKNLPRDESGAIIEGQHPGFEVKLDGLPSWAANVQIRPESVSLTVTEIPKDPPKED